MACEASQARDLKRDNADLRHLIAALYDPLYDEYIVALYKEEPPL